MLRCRSIASLQRTVSMPSLVDFSRASHLALFEQPARGFFSTLLGWCPVSEVHFNKSFGFYRHAGENRHPEVFEIPGFQVALATASLPGMTIELCKELLRHHLGWQIKYEIHPQLSGV